MRFWNYWRISAYFSSHEKGGGKRRFSGDVIPPKGFKYHKTRAGQLIYKKWDRWSIQLRLEALPLSELKRVIHPSPTW